MKDYGEHLEQIGLESTEQGKPVEMTDARGLVTGARYAHLDGGKEGDIQAGTVVFEIGPDGWVSPVEIVEPGLVLSVRALEGRVALHTQDSDGTERRRLRLRPGKKSRVIELGAGTVYGYSSTRGGASLNAPNISFDTKYVEVIHDGDSAEQGGAMLSAMEERELRKNPYALDLIKRFGLEPGMIRAALATTHEQITSFGDRRLYTPLEPVDPTKINADPTKIKGGLKAEVERVSLALKEVYDRQDGSPAGIAANQIGETLNMAYINIDGESPFTGFVINPSYKMLGPYITFPADGCMSFGSGDHSLVGPTKRSLVIMASWYELDGTFVEREHTFEAAVVFQHETDHLNGITFTSPDRMIPDGQPITLAEFNARRVQA